MCSSRIKTFEDEHRPCESAKPKPWNLKGTRFQGNKKYEIYFWMGKHLFAIFPRTKIFHFLTKSLNHEHMTWYAAYICPLARSSKDLQDYLKFCARPACDSYQPLSTIIVSGVPSKKNWEILNEMIDAVNKSNNWLMIHPEQKRLTLMHFVIRNSTKL